MTRIQVWLLQRAINFRVIVVKLRGFRRCGEERKCAQNVCSLFKFLEISLSLISCAASICECMRHLEVAQLRCSRLYWYSCVHIKLMINQIPYKKSPWIRKIDHKHGNFAHKSEIEPDLSIWIQPFFSSILLNYTRE